MDSARSLQERASSHCVLTPLSTTRQDKGQIQEKANSQKERTKTKKLKGGGGGGGGERTEHRVDLHKYLRLLVQVLQEVHGGVHFVTILVNTSVLKQPQQ